MLYQVFHFKTLKIVLGKTGTDMYIGYSIDTKYPIYSRPIIRGSIKEVVEVCIYLYTKRLLTAINCENYIVPSEEFNSNSDDDIQEWVEYVLNRYLFNTFRILYVHCISLNTCSYFADDSTNLIAYDEDGISILHWEDDSEYW